MMDKNLSPNPDLEHISVLFKDMLWLLEQRMWEGLPPASTFDVDALTTHHITHEKPFEALMFICYDPLHKRTILVIPIISNTKLNVTTAKALFTPDCELHKSVDAVVGFMNGGLTAPAKNHFESGSTSAGTSAGVAGTGTTTFEELSWSFIQTARNVLANIKLQRSNPESDLRKCKQYKLPKISSEDTISKLLSLQPNDIISIRSGFNTSWRWVG